MTRAAVTRFRKFPSLSVFPAHIDGVVEMQQQSFFAIEEAEAEKIVVDERRPRPYDDVPQREPGPFLSGHLRAQGGVAVHVADVRLKAGIGMVQQSSAPQFIGWSADLYGFVHRTGLEFSVAAAEQPQLPIRIEAAVPDPAPQEIISARQPEAVDFGNFSFFDIRWRASALFVADDLRPVGV